MMMIMIGKRWRRCWHLLFSPAAAAAAVPREFLENRGGAPWISSDLEFDIFNILIFDFSKDMLVFLLAKLNAQQTGIEAKHPGSHLIWNLTFFISRFLIFQFLRIGNRYILDGNLCQNSMHNKLEWPRVSTDFEFDFLTYLDKVVVRVVSIYFFVEKKTLCLTKMQWPGSILWVRGTFHYKNIFRGERREECENCEKSEKI